MTQLLSETDFPFKKDEVEEIFIAFNNAALP
jgi:hypothetical protein